MGTSTQTQTEPRVQPKAGQQPDKDLPKLIAEFTEQGDPPRLPRAEFLVAQVGGRRRDERKQEDPRGEIPQKVDLPDPEFKLEATAIPALPVADPKTRRDTAINTALASPDAYAPSLLTVRDLRSKSEVDVLPIPVASFVDPTKGTIKSITPLSDQENAALNANQRRQENEVATALKLLPGYSIRELSFVRAQVEIQSSDPAVPTTQYVTTVYNRATGQPVAVMKPPAELDVDPSKVKHGEAALLAKFRSPDPHASIANEVRLTQFIKGHPVDSGGKYDATNLTGYAAIGRLIHEKKLPEFAETATVFFGVDQNGEVMYAVNVTDMSKAKAPITSMREFTIDELKADGAPAVLEAVANKARIKDLDPNATRIVRAEYGDGSTRFFVAVFDPKTREIQKVLGNLTVDSDPTRVRNRGDGSNITALPVGVLK